MSETNRDSFDNKEMNKLITVRVRRLMRDHLTIKVGDGCGTNFDMVLIGSGIQSLVWEYGQDIIQEIGSSLMKMSCSGL